MRDDRRVSRQRTQALRFHPLPRTIGRAVVHKYELEACAGVLEETSQALLCELQLVPERDDDRELATCRIKSQSAHPPIRGRKPPQRTISAPAAIAVLRATGRRRRREAVPRTAQPRQELKREPAGRQTAPNSN